METTSRAVTYAGSGRGAVNTTMKRTLMITGAINNKPVRMSCDFSMKGHCEQAPWFSNLGRYCGHTKRRREGWGGEQSQSDS
mmetsp:Transcript_26368/g.69247  ORF Transcript_26368/g.69247 Transcript_26368/m.69247 type:complete len:82 (+) Transcript_26368:1488-1733(+)